MNNQYFGRNSNNHADYVTDHNRGVENGSGTELAGLYGYFLSDDSDSIPMPDSNRVPSNTIYYDTETIDNQAGNYSNVSENTESHHPIDITQGPIESVPIIENYMSPVSTPVVSGGCYLTAANTEIDKTQPEMVSALVPDELHSSISMNSKSELSADQLKSPGVEISTGESELTCSKYSLHALPLGAAEGAEEEKAQAEKTMMNSSKVIKSFVSNNSNLVSNSHDASRNKKRDPVVKGTNYRAPAQSGTPLSVAGVTSSVLAATETGAHLTKKYVGNIAQEAVSTIAPVATDAIESVSKDSAIRDTVDNIKNAVATVADVLHESFLFSIDRTKTFTDHYVIANTIMTDDPEYQHYLHQQRDHLKQRKRKETICNAEKTESRNREIKVGDKVLPLDQAWRLKCYLASLSWYQKHLIIETKEISEILIEASYDYGLLEDPIDIDSSEVPNTAIDGGYVHVDDSDGVENGSRAPNENGEVSAEQLAYMNFYLDKVDHPDDSNDTASEGEVEGDIMVRSGSTGNNDILQSAVKGNQTAQQELLKWFLPPPFACSNECSECHVSFSMRAFRHHCRHCGQSFCSKHAAKYHRIHKFGFATGTVRVCARCYDIIEREEYRDRSLWRVLRLKAYYKRELIPYFERRVDRTVDKVVRYVEVFHVYLNVMCLKQHENNYRVASGTLHLIRSTVSLNYAARIIIETVDIMRRYGLSGLAGVLMRQDFVEAVETLKKISGIDRMFALSLHELTACIYYKIAIERGLRGCNPTAEAIDHDDYAFQVYSNEKDQEGNPMSSQLPGPLTVNPIPVRSSPLGETNDGIYEVEDGELESMIEFAPMALEFAYLPSPVDCERLAHAVGYDTLFFHNELQHSSSNALNEAERPAYVLLASSTDESAHTANKEKIAILAVRGTQTVQDIVTDIRAEPVSFPPDGKWVKPCR